MKVLKVLFVGLGSIAGRHIKNFSKLLESLNQQFVFSALRSSNNDINEDIKRFISQSYYSVEEVPDDFDMIFITNPTSLHFSYIESLKNKTKNMFIEKPIFDSYKYDINSIKQDLKLNYYVACPLRHSLLFKKIEEICKSEKVNCVRAICSSYLPDWRPDIDYRNSYSAKANLGGGVDLDLIHELDYLIALFSFPNKIYSIRKKVSSLEIDSCDICSYILDYSDKVVEVHLDYFGRKSERKLAIYTDDDIIIADFLKQEVKWLITGQTIQLQETRDEWCSRELLYFYNLCFGIEKNNINDINYAYKILKYALKGV